MPVYILRAGDTEMVKIGWAVNVAQRRRELQCGHYLELRPIREIRGGRAVEVEMHRLFRAQRVRNEWFTFHPDMLTVEPIPAKAPSKAVRPPPNIHAQAIHAAGGRTAVASALGLATETVKDWQKRGTPARYWSKLVGLASAKLPELTIEQFAQSRPSLYKSRPSPLTEMHPGA